MLHEVLLALSGHPSPLFEHGRSEEFPLISSAERALLTSVGHLANLHRTLRSKLTDLSNSHPSIVCRAVANSVLSLHLFRFQQSILDVEKQILSRDPSLVGAYNIVPLAGVVKQFDGWKRRLEWYEELSTIMLPEKISGANLEGSSSICSGAAVMDYLRASSNSGYTDVADAVMELERIADGVWLRLLSTWILHGQLSDLGSHDLFIKLSESSKSKQPEYVIRQELLPLFLDMETASSILFVGKIVNLLATQSRRNGVSSFDKSLHSISEFVTTSPSMAKTMQKDHSHLLSSISLPIKPTILSTTVKHIRRSLSNRLADEVLPVHELMHTFYMMRKFFLGGQVDFYDILIEQADKHIAARHLQLRVDPQHKGSGDLAGVVMKQGELAAILSRTWAELAPLVLKGEIVEDEFEWAREHVRLTLSKYTITENSSSNSISANLSKLGMGTFSDLLLSTPAMLNLDLGSTFGLFLSSEDLQIYSIMHTYLLGIRRGQNHISKLWRQCLLRRHTQTISASTMKNSEGLVSSVSDHRNKMEKRANAMRKIWASSNAAVFMLSELGGYFVESVVKASWERYNVWAVHSNAPSNTNTRSTNIPQPPSFNSSEAYSAHEADTHKSIIEVQNGESDLPRDPEALANAHHLYLLSLVESLLLTDSTFTRYVRNLLTAVDLLVGFVERLQRAQSNLMLHDGDNQTEYLHRKLLREEDFLYNETKKASDKIDVAVQCLVKHLHEISITRSRVSRVKTDQDDFDPWDSAGSIEKLLVKLDFGVKVEQ